MSRRFIVLGILVGSSLLNTGCYWHRCGLFHRWHCAPACSPCAPAYCPPAGPVSACASPACAPCGPVVVNHPGPAGVPVITNPTPIPGGPAVYPGQELPTPMPVKQ